MQIAHNTLKSKGFGFLDLMITLVLLGLLAAVAIPSYSRFVERGKTAKAIGDIGALQLEITEFDLRNRRLPASLDELGIDLPLDPWDQNYVYLNIEDAGPGFGDMRKDGKLNPLNTDYDLYSIGKDGDSQGPLNAKASHDDIVRANNGNYIGRGEDY